MNSMRSLEGCTPILLCLYFVVNAKIYGNVLFEKDVLNRDVPFSIFVVSWS